MERSDLLSCGDIGERGPRPFDTFDTGELSRLDAAELDCEFTERDRDLCDDDAEPLLASPPPDSPDDDDDPEAEDPGLDLDSSLSI